VSDPSLGQIARAAAARSLESVHTVLPARVVSYLPLLQTCACEILVDPPGEEPWPDLSDVPVVWPRGGGFALHLPLTTGDCVWLHFAEADFSAWRTTGSKGYPALERRHGIFPFAVPGAAPETDPLIAPSGTAVFGKLPAGPFVQVGDASIELGHLVAPLAEYVALAGKTIVLLSAAAGAAIGAATPNDGGKAAFTAFKSAIDAGGAAAVGATVTKAE